MEIMTIGIVVFAVIIGLVIGYVSISAKMKSSQEAAELMLLNAEQEATNLRGQAEREADLLVNEAERESKSLKKEALLEAKEEARKYREEVLGIASYPIKNSSTLFQSILQMVSNFVRQMVVKSARDQSN